SENAEDHNRYHDQEAGQNKYVDKRRNPFEHIIFVIPLVSVAHSLIQELLKPAIIFQAGPWRMKRHRLGRLGVRKSARDGIMSENFTANLAAPDMNLLKADGVVEKNLFELAVFEVDRCFVAEKEVHADHQTDDHGHQDRRSNPRSRSALFAFFLHRMNSQVSKQRSYVRRGSSPHCEDINLLYRSEEGWSTKPTGSGPRACDRKESNFIPGHQILRFRALDAQGRLFQAHHHV